ncbi:DUF6026 family protein [Pseudomonas bharatica]|uniref:DUF6026 family protein n=1 Tax=Pseudomonas TaxID=286 RepID=UPI003B27E0A8
MQTLISAAPPQTLYVSIRRDELQRLKQERDALQEQVAQLNLLLQQARLGDHALTR